jgi:hypothetical protein
MPFTKAEIVDIDFSENKVKLASLFGNTFYNEKNPCTAQEAIDFVLNSDSTGLIRLMNQEE